MIGPRFAPVGEKFGAVPVADFGSKTLLVHLAHGQHDMGVWLGFAVSADIPMNIEVGDHPAIDKLARSEEHTSELQSLMRLSYAVFCLKKKIFSFLSFFSFFPLFFFFSFFTFSFFFFFFFFSLFFFFFSF